MRHLFTAGLASIAFAMPFPTGAQDAPSAPGTVTVDANDFLQGYYDALRTQVTLPVAPEAPALADKTVLTRITFGSCNHQSLEQHMWNRIAAADPQLFMMIGDNVYGDNLWEGDAGLTSLREAYATFAERPEFIRFRSQVPMLTTWDDHDFGYNDGGDNFAFRGWAEAIYENFWQSPENVRERPGVYHSRIVGEDGRRVQIILLDTRFFRSSLDRPPYSRERPALGPYVPTQATDRTMLGEEQWEWLEEELAKPADLRLVVSSIQVLTDAHRWESWALMPAERAKLLDMVAGRNGGGVVLLSGDRHAGGIYQASHNGEEMWELTSSSLNLPFTDTATNTAREPDPLRVSDFISEENFGLLEIDWPRQEIMLSLRGAEGETRASRTISFAP